MDVAPPYRNVVDVVRRVAIAGEDALDRKLGVLAPLAAYPALAVVEEQLDRGATYRRPVPCSIEDNVLHRLAPQRRGPRFAQDPAHRIDDVGLAATVGTDDADELTGGGDYRRIDE